VRKVRNLVIGVLVIAVLVTSIIFGGCAPAPREPEVGVLKYGYMGPLSGPWATWGLSESISQEIYVDWINEAGGITVAGKRYMIELVKYDNAGDPAAQLTVGRRCVDEGIKFVKTCYDAECMATNDLFNANKILNIASCSGFGMIGRKWPYTFKCWFCNQDGMEVQMEYLGEQFPDKRRVVAIHSDDGGGRSSMAEMEAATTLCGFELVDRIFYAPEAIDFHAILTRVIAMDVDYIELGTCPPPAMALIIKQARELGWDKPFMETDSIDVGTYVEVIGWEGMENIYTTPDAVEFTTELGRRWAEEFESPERYGSPYNSQAIHADTMWMLFKSIEEAGTFDVDEVIKVMETGVWDMAYGPTWYRPRVSGEANRMVCTAVPMTVIRGGERVDVLCKVSPRWR